MTRRTSINLGLRAGIAAGLIAALTPVAHALTAAGEVHVDAWTGREPTAVPLVTCIPTAINAGGLQVMGQDCSVPNAGTASTRALANAQAPAAFDPYNPASYQLARLGARSSLAVEVHSFNGTGRFFNDAPIAVTTQAWARYTDYLMLGPARPASLQLDFHLSGELLIAPALAGTFNSFQVDAIYGLGAGAGHVTADGTFAAASPDAYGLVQVRRQLKLPGATPTVDPWIDSHPVGNITHSETPSPFGGTDVRVTLGAGFFNNPDNNLVLLDLSLATSAYGPAWSFKDLPFGTVLTGNEITGDFASTFEMVGLQAFDDLGQDITASAVLGFQSLQAVPEPQAWLLMAAGLIGLALRGCSTRPHSPRRYGDTAERSATQPLGTAPSSLRV